MKPPVIGWPAWVRVVVAVLAVGLACPGCSLSPPERAQAAISTGADVVVVFDREAAQRLTAATEAALVEASSLAEWTEAVQPWKRLVLALGAVKSALLAAQAAINVWEATGDDTAFRSVAACLAAQLDLLFEAARAVDFGDKLERFEAVAAIAAAYTDGLCPEGAR